MQTVHIRDAAPDDFDAICAMNLTEERYTSPMDGGRLAILASLSCYHKVGCVQGRPAAFLLAMAHDARYRNDNFEWFAKRFPLFLYVDRIVVSPAGRGQRLGSLLYEDLFGYARANGFARVTCEYDVAPLNEPSRRFHDKFGFTEQGTRWAADGAKRVSLQAAVP